MKSILYITSFVPSVISAGENFSRQLIQDLGKSNKVDLIYFKSPNCKNFINYNFNIKVIKEYKSSFKLKIFNWLKNPKMFPLFNVRYNTKIMNEIEAISKLTHYDFVVLDFSQSFIYGFFIDNNKILIVHDVITQRFSRKLSFLKFWVKYSENLILTQQKSVLFTFSFKDKFLLKKYFNLNSIVTDFFLDEMIFKVFPVKVSNYFVFFGRWNRNDNLNGLIWFFKKVFPFISKEIKIKIIGGDLDDKTKNLLSKFSNVQYLGFVENPYQIISNSKALIAPIFSGAGVKVKIIDSLACGTPVIGTDVALEGINENFNSYLHLCNSPNDFIKKINSFNIELNEKIILKNSFIYNYNNKSIIDFINN
jgi:glycosyltransferase involved in cell wall biosynthesis